MGLQTGYIILSVVCAVVGLGIGIGFGSLINRNASSDVIDTVPQEDPDASRMIMDQIKADNIRENLRTLTSEPHIAGRIADEVTLVNFIADRWRASKFEVEIHPYDVLLSYPNQTDSNYIAIKMDNGTLVYKSHPTEAILDDSQNKTGVVNPFNAYSGTGDAEGDLVYVNYGTIEDFIEINKTIDLKGKICIARYGNIFRGDKALHAEQYKCAGLILYSDPKDYTVQGAGVYPDSSSLPGTGAQRGSLVKSEGDPLTIHYPSIDTAWRRKVEDTQLPTIPVTPIGYDDAILYLSRMNGDEVPEGWRGSLNITYRYGPGFIAEHASSKIKMHVTTSNQRAVIHNVIGYIRGYVEPDRYVIIGNHRDAWVFGAIDPSSGTAAMLEISRAYGEAVKNGWRPRRTIVFCSWAAEEYGLIGSSEWVEEFQKVLSFRTVAYINVDGIVSGGYSLDPSGLPSVYEIIHESAKLVPSPDTEGETVDDVWERKLGASIGRLGAGSDYTLFVQLTGITALNIRYIFDPTVGVSGYPVYHSVYETFEYVEKYIDPGFKYNQAASRVVAEIGRNLIDSPLLPLKVIDYAAQVTKDMNNMLAIFETDLTTNGMNTELLNDAMKNFTSATEDFQQRISDLDIIDQLALRAINDQLMQLERAFIDKNGIEGRDQFSHVIYAPTLHDRYGEAAFPGLVDSMFEISSDPDQEGRWEEVRRQFSILLYHIGSAASTLRDVAPIRGYSNQ